MSRGLTFSGQVRAYIDTLEEEEDRGLTPQEREEAASNRDLLKDVVSEVINSRETLTDSGLKYRGEWVVEKLVERASDLIEDLLDEYYTRELVDAVPGYVSRTLQFSRLEATRTPSKVTNTYVREATRAYIMGLPQACVALCRAALEQGLKENLGYQLSGVFIEFHKLLDEAERCHLLDKPTKKAVRDIAKKADDVLHEKPISVKEALGVLEGVRALLPQIYSARGGY